MKALVLLAALAAFAPAQDAKPVVVAWDGSWSAYHVEADIWAVDVGSDGTVDWYVWWGGP